MMEKSRKIRLGDVLLVGAVKVFELRGFADGNVLDKEGKPVDWDNCLCHEFETSVKLSDCSVDAVLLFGDGTLEFRTNSEGVNWSEFELHDLHTMLSAMNDEVVKSGREFLAYHKLIEAGII